MPGFTDCVKSSWEVPSSKAHPMEVLMDKFKRLRRVLKHWQRNFSSIKVLISKCNRVIFILDCLEDFRKLSVPESNFRKIVKLHLEKLLHWQHVYWKKRCTQRYIKVGEENSKFTQAMDSERHRRNSIVSLNLPNGTVCE